MTADVYERAPGEVLHMLLPPNQVVTVVDERGTVTGQMWVVACTGTDVEVRIQRGDFRDGPINVRVGGGGVAWDLEGLLIHTHVPHALLANLALVGRVQQRAWVRVPFPNPIQVSDEEGYRFELDGIDLSAGGLAARCDEPPPRQATATFIVAAGGTPSTVRLSVKVVRARCQPDGRWRVAYEFDRIDPATHNRLIALVTRLTTRTNK
jgi:hypothetical protein